MRIKRKYELLGILYENDQPSREAIDSAFDLCNVSEERRKQLLEWNGAFIPAFFNIGCMIPGECYKAFMRDSKSLMLLFPTIMAYHSRMSIASNSRPVEKVQLFN